MPSWLVTIQLSPSASPGKQPETANLLTQTDRRDLDVPAIASHKPQSRSGACVDITVRQRPLGTIRRLGQWAA